MDATRKKRAAEIVWQDSAEGVLLGHDPNPDLPEARGQGGAAEDCTEQGTGAAQHSGGRHIHTLEESRHCE